MTGQNETARVRENIIRAVAEQLAAANFDWSAVERLTHPTLHFEATIRDQTDSSRRETRRGLSVSHVVDLTEAITPEPPSPSQVETGNNTGAQSHGLVPRAILPTSEKQPPTPSDSGKAPPFVAYPDEDDGRRVDTGNMHPPPPPTSSPKVIRCSVSHKAISGLRPSRDSASQIVEDNTQRQMQIAEANWPKRRKQEAVGYSLKPSTLDKLVVGIWEQIHGGFTMAPQDFLGRLASGQKNPDGACQHNSSLIPSSTYLSEDAVTATTAAALSQAFSNRNIFCRKVTQASRTYRSIEVIVQAHWVQHFDDHVQALKEADPSLSETKHRKSALMAACDDFGWSEKELRNKMAVWRGYAEIKEQGGWAALVFAGMGIYRFCKYRIGFDRDSMQRLRALRPAIEVAADTLHPQWRGLLAVVGGNGRRGDHHQNTPGIGKSDDMASPSLLEPKYTGHPHDWVVFLDGSPPMPLRASYLQWDPYFTFRHLDESVVDEHEWGCDDPRWSPPTRTATLNVPSTAASAAIMDQTSSSRGISSGGGDNTSSTIAAAAITTTHGAAAAAAVTSSTTKSTTTTLPLCDVCDKEQSDDAKINACYCFPSLFGGARVGAPSPVQVFHTSNGRNNGLLALCGFERGAPVGEFVGVVTKGLQDVDVMESFSESGSTATGHLKRSSITGAGGGVGGGGGTMSTGGLGIGNTGGGGGVSARGAGRGGKTTYQIWQGRQGNFTRFVNHSCNSNAQYQRFRWMGTQRVVLVSKGIEAGAEITVDYSDRYWKGLDKVCLCGEKSCRYRTGR